MLTFRQLLKAMQGLGVPAETPVIAHASLSAFGEVHGGAETLLGAMLTAFPRLMMPTFTYRTMVTPEVGPEHNGLRYGSGEGINQTAQFFHPDMPADPLMGRVAERLRRSPRARRSMHPILSFAGIGVDEALAAQTLHEPLAPIGVLLEAGGYVLLLGVDHTSNTSIHYAERLAGRKQFVRWALTPRGVVECPGFPGASDGFNQIEPHLEGTVRRIPVGKTRIQAIPLQTLIRTARQLIETAPQALLPPNSADLRVQDTLLAAGVQR